MASNYNPVLITGTNHRDTQSLHPKVRKIADQYVININNYIKSLGLDNVEVKIISTLRTWAEQNALYAQGRTKPGRIVTNAPAGKSIHNWGCAFDIGIFKNGVYNDNSINYLYTDHNFVKIGKDLKLFWGGDWNSIKDYPHYEFLNGLKDADFLSKVTVANLDKLLDYES